MPWPKQIDPRVTQPGEIRIIRSAHLCWMIHLGMFLRPDVPVDPFAIYQNEFDAIMLRLIADTKRKARK